MLIGTWPTDLPRPFDGSYAPFVRSLSGGQALDGTEQVQPQLHDRWGASFSFHMGTDTRVLAMRALLTRMRGRANSILLPAFDRSRGPYAVTAGAAPAGVDVGDVYANPPCWQRFAQIAGTAYEFSARADVTGTATVVADDRVSFAATGTAPAAGLWLTLSGERREILALSGSGPYLLTIRPRLAMTPESGSPDTLGNTIAATLSADADMNATQVPVLFSAGGPPLPGHLFSLGNRMHSIDAVTVTGAGAYTLEIWPWLRADVASGTTANFMTPACEMRFRTDQEGVAALEALRLGLWGDVTLRFDEVAAI